MLNAKMKKAGLKSARQFHFLQRLVESQKYQTSENFLFLTVSDLQLLSKVSVQTSIKYLIIYEKLGYIKFQPLRPANNKKINQYAIQVLQPGQSLIERELKRSQKIKLYNKRRRQDDADFEF